MNDFFPASGGVGGGGVGWNGGVGGGDGVELYVVCGGDGGSDDGIGEGSGSGISNGGVGGGCHKLRCWMGG